MKLLIQTSPESIPENDNYMFRYDANTYYNDSITLTCEVYTITSRTPKGVWIVSSWVNLSDEEDIKRYRKFVLNGNGKRFAYPTRELAKNAFLFRKRRQIEILKSQLSKAESAYVVAGGTLPIPTRSYRYYEDY